MKKLSEAFTTCEESFSDTEPVQCVACHNENDTFHPLMRTTKIITGKSTFDDVVERMIQSPDHCSSEVSSGSTYLPLSLMILN